MQHRQGWCQTSNAAPSACWDGPMDGPLPKQQRLFEHLNTSSLRVLLSLLITVLCGVDPVPTLNWIYLSCAAEEQSDRQFYLVLTLTLPFKELGQCSNRLPRGFYAFLKKQWCMRGLHALTERPPSFTEHVNERRVTKLSEKVALRLEKGISFYGP